MSSKIRDSLANYAHESWVGWMKYLFEKSERQSDGSVVIPKELVDRWMRQMSTSYNNLSPEEQQSDQLEVDKILACLEPHFKHFIEFIINHHTD